MAWKRTLGSLLVCWGILMLEAAGSHIAILVNSQHLSQDSVRGNSLIFITQPTAIATPTSDTHSVVTIEALLNSPSRFHKQSITVRGTISQPEIHLDETTFFLNFVFVLKDQEHTIIVFGQHDRTQGSIPIAMNNSVQVEGVFWKDRIANDYHFENNIEAMKVTLYPSLTPERM